MERYSPTDFEIEINKLIAIMQANAVGTPDANCVADICVKMAKCFKAFCAFQEDTTKQLATNIQALRQDNNSIRRLFSLQRYNLDLKLQDLKHILDDMKATNRRAHTLAGLDPIANAMADINAGPPMQENYLEDF